MQRSMIRLGTYSMLLRAGYDMSGVKETMDADAAQCETVLGGKALLFSPSQTIRRTQVEDVLGFKMGSGIESQHHIETFDSAVEDRDLLNTTQVWKLSIPEDAATEMLTSPEDSDFLHRVNQMVEDGKSSRAIVNDLFDYYIDATQQLRLRNMSRFSGFQNHPRNGFIMLTMFGFPTKVQRA